MNGGNLCVDFHLDSVVAVAVAGVVAAVADVDVAVTAVVGWW